MNVLITAGNTHAPIDRVRVITNIFTGRTGASLARAAHARGHRLTILTSHPETITETGITVVPYITFDDLAERLEREVRSGQYGAVLHAAAVSDYLSAGVFTADRTELRAGKIKSDEPELWLRLVRAPKLIDRFRSPWGFTGTLVKFKLEVGVSDEKLLDIAERSRVHSGADLMVANTLEGSTEYAFLGPLAGNYERLTRAELPDRLLQEVERHHRSPHG